MGLRLPLIEPMRSRSRLRVLALASTGACVHARTFTALMRPLPLRLLAFTRLPLVPESL